MDWLLYTLCLLGLSSLLVLKGKVVSWNTGHHRTDGWTYKDSHFESGSALWQKAQLLYGSSAFRCGIALLTIDGLVLLALLFMNPALLQIGALLLLAAWALCLFGLPVYVRNRLLSNDSRSSGPKKKSSKPKPSSTRLEDARQKTAADTKPDSAKAAAANSLADSNESVTSAALLSDQPADKADETASAGSAASDQKKSESPADPLDPDHTARLAKSILADASGKPEAAKMRRMQHIESEIEGNGFSVSRDTSSCHPDAFTISRTAD